MFTLNNPLPNELNQVLNDTNTKCLLAVLEQAGTGTVHYQGVLQLKSPRAMSTLRNLIPRAHLEIQKGTKKEAYEYVMKTCDKEAISGSLVDTWKGEESHIDGTNEDGTCPSELMPIIGNGFGVTFGELQDQLNGKKKRSLTERLLEIQTKIRAGVTEEEISEDYFPEWLRYRQSFKAYKALHCSPRDFKTEVTVIQGPTGTGKSRYCMEEYPDAYWKTRDLWWDGYEAHETVIIDEFYGWIPFDLLLRMLDRYPLQVEVKGGKVNFCPKRIILTTNKVPSTWYKEAYFPALARRVEHWWVFGTVFHTRYTDYYKTKFIEDGGPQEGDINVDF